MSENGSNCRPEFSFGVELEIVIVFHEAAIKSCLSNPSAYLMKLHTEDELRADLCPYGYSDLQFRSWAIANDGPGPEWIADPEASIKMNGEDIDIPIRPYMLEPLTLVKRCFKRSKSPWLHNVQVYFDGRFPYVKQSSYVEWTVTGEPSIQGLESDQMKDFLIKNGPRISRSMKNDLPEQYDSWGIKLVSPVYHSRKQLSWMKEQLDDLVGAIPIFGNDREREFMAYCTNDCGLHVHINRKLDVGTLRYLALLLVVYEDEILRLIPKHRRDLVNGDTQHPGIASQIMSNRENFHWDEDEPLVRTYTDLNGDIKTGDFKFKFRPIDKIREIIFTNNLTPDKELEYLQRLMGSSRSKLVSFAYLSRDNGPRTVEFRQHEGTLNPFAIESWVRFCLGLVELSWEMSNNEHLFPARTWEDRIWIEDLFTAMNLESQFVQWFRQRMKSFGDDGRLRTLEHLYVRCES